MNIRQEDLAKTIEATVAEIFSSMIMMDVARVSVARYADEGAEPNITSVLGLGGNLRGAVAVHLPGKVATRITSNFLGIDVVALDEDVKDAIGEVANMIAGGMKMYFTSLGITTELAIANTIIGNSYRMGGLGGAKRLQVAFSCAAGMFLVEVRYIDGG